jgi:hypothetical protein
LADQIERKVGFRSGAKVADEVRPAFSRAAVPIVLAIFPAGAALNRLACSRDSLEINSSAPQSRSFYKFDDLLCAAELLAEPDARYG